MVIQLGKRETFGQECLDDDYHLHEPQLYNKVKGIFSCIKLDTVLGLPEICHRSHQVA